jgi:tetratricopeptide (TPR) repeat protein
MILQIIRSNFRLIVVLVLTLPAVNLQAAETVAACKEMLCAGLYEKCLAAAADAVGNRSYGEEWPILKAECELALGKYSEALQTIDAGIERYSWSVRLRLLEYKSALANGKRDQAATALAETERLVRSASWRYTDADDLVALGEIALALGADAKAVQEGFFERARRNYPNYPDGFLAAGRLALKKGDVAFAVELLGTAEKSMPEQADITFFLSEAFRTSDPEHAAKLLKRSLELNPRFAPALLRVAEQQIDGEDYSGAEKTLKQLLTVNPHQPEAHSLQAVIFYLRNEAAEAESSRVKAVAFSETNPEVDHLIGRKLSQKYRFAEGADFQRKALEADADFVEAKIQLAQDLLRLGQEAEGWIMAEQAYEADGYNTTLFNLLQLKDSLARFTTITSEHFQVRMETQEGGVYGQRVVDLLEEAWSELTSRYDFVPQVPVYIEIYPRVDDFAVRTFGVPDVAGFLGVCFGKVVTANSPATRKENPGSWESVLWHEFCHVITLQKTSNKMPRWLSEGISVFEERRKDPRWGQHINPDFRDRIFAGKVTPVADLSSAFLMVGSGEDLNFAYYESSMLVEHLVTLHGLPALNAILKDLNDGIQINDALERHTDGLPELEASFAKYLESVATVYASGVEFTTEELVAAKPTDLTAVKEFLERHPKNFAAMLLHGSLLVNADQLDEAEVELSKLIALVPQDDSTSGPRRRLAEIYRRRSQAEKEIQVLTEHLQYSADDLDAALRLQELFEEKQKKNRVVEIGKMVFAIDPFQSAALTRTAIAAEATGQMDIAVSMLRSLLPIQKDDAARLHFQIATLLRSTAPESARQHVLLSLAHAPRYRDAHKLLLQLVSNASTGTASETPAVELEPPAAGN